MLNKIVVRNVGLLKAFDTPNARKLDKLTLFYGRNGRGKSTLTSVLRAARDGEASLVLGRQSLGNGGAAPKVVLTSAAETITFENGAWSVKSAPIEVFDTTFITDNVYAGELVELTHDRGLFSIIIGAAGVRLGKRLECLNQLAKSRATALKDAESALAADVPTDMSKEEFFALGPSPEYAERLDAAERALKAVQQADMVSGIKALEPLAMPTLPPDLSTVLASTVAEIETSARNRLLDHYKRFGFDRNAEAWISYGIDHIHDDACPLCGRDDVNAGGMVTLYSQIFGETYKAHLATITAALSELEDSLGEEARTRLAERIAANADSATKWAEYVQLGTNLPPVSELVTYVAEANRIAKTLLDQKRSSPLDVIKAEHEFAELRKVLAGAQALVETYNGAVGDISAAIKEAFATTPMSDAAAVLARDNVKKRVARHDAGVQARVDAFNRAKRREERVRNQRTRVQKALKKANEDAAEHYHERVNFYLSRFGASFSISKISNSMQGNAGQVDYGLQIKGEKIARGRGRQADAIPTFRNTLSAGDKTTLAFAFFLAKIDQDPDLACKTLVIDDPLSSHDSHRRRETVNAIKDLCARCLQVIVLSHDEFLLREVQHRCMGVPFAAFQIDIKEGDEWSTASAIDLDQLCRTEHAKMVQEIMAFVDERKGNPDHVVLNVRRVLETHYRRSYMAYFPQNCNLGQIVRIIAATGLSHPCHRDLKRLENCNDATCNRHHGDDAVLTVKQGIDPDELRVIAADTLQLIGARQPDATEASP